MDQITKLGPVQAFTKFWGTLNGTQRFITAVFLSLSAVLLIVVSVVATRPRQAVLFSGLQPDDAGAIVAKLQENKVAYEVDGSTIKVPEKNVHELRMQLASQGLPEGGNVGFELLDKNGGLGMTEFSQRTSYQRALQGELSRTINQLDSVLQSRVHIAIPEESVFAGNEKQPTASVFVKLKPGTVLNSDQVGGIVHLVSSAVEGLQPSRVTVVDTNGNLLSEGSDESTGLDPRLSASQLRLKREHERGMERNIQSMLERVLGPNKAIVRVNARINFDRTETNSENYRPLSDNKGVVLSEERLTETYTGSSGTTGGVAGMRASIRPGSAVSASVDEGGYQRTETTSTYQVSRTTEHVVRAPGQVEQVSVAVIVDGKVESAKIPAIRNAVATAAGIDPLDTTSGNKITVEQLDFDDTAGKQEAKELAAIESRASYLSIAKTVGAVLLLVGFLFFLKSMLKQVRISIPEPVTVQEIPASEVAFSSAYPGTQSAAPAGATGNGDIAPEAVAQTLRKWMSES